MDLPEKGSHCALASCQIFDLLPIRCTACDTTFCRNHALRDAHACEAPGTPASVGREPTSSSDRVACQVDKCGHAALLKPAVGEQPAPGWSCDACHGIYCISHRHTDAHNCVPISTTAVSKKADAQALLSKLFPDAKSGAGASSNANRARPLPTDPAKLAKLRAIELMKMKHKAVAADPSQAKGSGIQAGDKIHLRIVYAPSGGTKTEKVLWYLKDIVAGKAVDLAARALLVSREDGRAVKLVRGYETDGAMDVKNNQTLGAQVEDGDEVQLVKEE
ncbi:hypothetical protein BDV93DRAFT_517169 [Ceratobasidium sp. AG-I]|nr:hypothetical protein BDV93DRAFT_517169 [Ceratobasidium sp. AG-I]